MIKKIQSYIYEHQSVKALKLWSQQTSLPGFQGVSIFDVSGILWKEVFKNPFLMMRANAIAFSFFMSLFPALLVLLSLIPYLPIETKKILPEIRFIVKEVMPTKAGEELYTNIANFLKVRRSDFLSLGFLLAIYFSSNGLMALQTSFEKTHAVFKKRKPIQKRLRAIGMTLMLGVMAVVSFILIILGNQLLTWSADWLGLSKFTQNILDWLRWLLTLAFLYFGICIIYRFGVAMRRRLNFFSPGASIATIASIVTSILFSFYVDTFTHYNRLYNSFVAGVVLLLWLQFNAVILILGFEVNAAIAVHRGLSQKECVND